MTHPATPLDTLRALALGQHAGRVAEYRALWSDLWDGLRVKWGVPPKIMNEDVRAIVLGILIDGVPVDTARMVATEYMRGIANEHL